MKGKKKERDGGHKGSTGYNRKEGWRKSVGNSGGKQGMPVARRKYTHKRGSGLAGLTMLNRTMGDGGWKERWWWWWGGKLWWSGG